MNITVDMLGLDELIKGYEDAEKNQIPFAESRTVNRLAYETQRDTIDRLLPENFILRNDWWRPGRRTGVNYFPSNKRQFPNVRAVVNTLAPWMEFQETGGIKRPRAGSAFVPIPTFNAQPNKREVVRPNRRYRALTSAGKGSRRTLMHRRSPWIGTLKSGKPSVAVRLLDDYRLPIAVMYLGADSVTIKPRFGFRANAKRIVEKRADEVWEIEMTNALRTAKIK